MGVCAPFERRPGLDMIPTVTATAIPVQMNTHPPPPVVWGVTLKRTPPKTPEDGQGIDPCNKFFVKLFFLPLSVLAWGLGTMIYIFLWCMSCIFWIFCLADYFRVSLCLCSLFAAHIAASHGSVLASCVPRRPSRATGVQAGSVQVGSTPGWLRKEHGRM